MNNCCKSIEAHVTQFWSDRDKLRIEIKQGPIADSIPGFSILRFSETREKPYWIYCTLGCFKAGSGHQRYEFFLLSPVESSSHVLTLSMLANFHADPNYRLDVGSIVEIGDSWIPGSLCDHLLISLPYTFGPKLEWVELSTFCVRILWALPITRREAEFARREGVNQLEQKFDNAVLPYLDPLRLSVV